MSGEGSKGSVQSNWANLEPDCLLEVFSKLTVEEMLAGPLQVCKLYADRSQGDLKSIKIKLCTDESISYVAHNCPNLEVLWLTSCPSVTDASMFKIASNCNKLKELCIRSSKQITDNAVQMVREKYPNVVILDS